MSCVIHLLFLHNQKYKQMGNCAAALNDGKSHLNEIHEKEKRLQEERDAFELQKRDFDIKIEKLKEETSKLEAEKKIFEKEHSKFLQVINFSAICLISILTL